MQSPHRSFTVRLGVQTPCGLAREGARLGAPGVGGCYSHRFEHPVGCIALRLILLIRGLANEHS